MTILDFARFAETPLETEPYDHIVVPNFVRAEHVPAVMADFPPVSGHGSFPLDSVSAGPSFSRLVEEFRHPDVAEAFSRKFGVDITERPLMASVRGEMHPRDGRIHTDSKGKIITVLIYMNESWPHAGGRLRILRDGKNLENYTAEVPPLAGTLLAFRRGDASWHGHKPFIGPRRSIQLNWVVDESYREDQYTRHGISAALKGLGEIFAGH